MRAELLAPHPNHHVSPRRYEWCSRGRMSIKRLLAHLIGVPPRAHAVRPGTRCPRCAAEAGRLSLLTSTSAYLVCEACRHRWQHARRQGAAVLALTVAAFSTLTMSPAARTGSAASDAMARFLETPMGAHSYAASRRLEATGKGQHAWLDAHTDFSPATGLRYEVVAEGGSGYIRSRVLRALLEEERRLIARGATDAVAVSPENYRFTAAGVSGDDLVQVTLEPRRKDRSLIDGRMFLRPADGELVRIEGRLSKNPSFWTTRVDVVRSYRRINEVLVPVSLESIAQVRLVGRSTLRMTYQYSLVDGQPVRTGE
jgi:hypothetical protein